MEPIRPIEPEGLKQKPVIKVNIPRLDKVETPPSPTPGQTLEGGNVHWMDLIKLWLRENLINDIFNSQNGVNMNSKLWYTSKTLWLNIIGLVWMFVGPMIGIPTLDTEAMATVLAVINVILRLITKGPVTIS